MSLIIWVSIFNDKVTYFNYCGRWLNSQSKWWRSIMTSPLSRWSVCLHSLHFYPLSTAHQIHSHSLHPLEEALMLKFTFSPFFTYHIRPSNLKPARYGTQIPLTRLPRPSKISTEERIFLWSSSPIGEDFQVKTAQYNTLQYDVVVESPKAQ